MLLAQVKPKVVRRMKDEFCSLQCRGSLSAVRVLSVLRSPEGVGQSRPEPAGGGARPESRQRRLNS